MATDESLVENVCVGEHLASSDHNAIRFVVNTCVDVKISTQLMPRFGSCNFDTFRERIKDVDWGMRFENRSVGEMYTELRRTLLSVNFDLVKYVRRKSGKSMRAPWVSPLILSLIKDRNRKFQIHKNNESFISRQNYIDSRREVKRAVRDAKRKYEIKLAKDSKKEPKRFYGYVNSRKPLKGSIGPIKDKDGRLTEIPAEMSKILNEHFTSVFTVEDSSELGSLVEEVDNSDICISDITVNEVEILKYINLMKKSKSPGPDGVYPTHLKELKNELAKPLRAIFNRSLEDGVVPVDFKRANVTPIFKNGNRYEATNFRPISLTSVVGKLLESVIRDRIVSHLELNNLIKDSQHGFRRARSCLTNLLEFFHKMICVYDESKAVDVIYLDFKKAFDTVPHERLLMKVKAVGVKGKILNWIRNWLKDRSQRVVINGECSDWVNVSSGVPQGSVLGPLLFLIYINDLDNGVFSTISKFADDTKLGNRAYVRSDVEKLQKDLNLIVRWADKWQMQFNLSKCKVMHLGCHNLRVEYTMKGQVLDVVKLEKDLGVLVSDDFKVTKQCADACKKANRVLGYIARNFTFKSKEIILPLYKSLVRPLLEYAVQFWAPYLNKDIAQLERVQRRATKLIPELRNRPYEERLRALDLPSLEGRRLRGQLIEVFKILKGFSNVDYRNLFELDHRGNTRQHGLKLVNKRFNTSIAQNYFTFKITQIWNRLPTHVVDSRSVNMFKNRLDAHLNSINIT